MVMNNAKLYLYEEDHQIIGFVGMVENYLAGIFVASNGQSKGIKTKLLKHLQNNYHTLSLHIYQKNDQAVKFYLHHDL